MLPKRVKKSLTDNNLKKFEKNLKVESHLSGNDNNNEYFHSCTHG